MKLYRVKFTYKGYLAHLSYVKADSVQSAIDTVKAYYLAPGTQWDNASATEAEQ
jgi:hypothetical protein